MFYRSTVQRLCGRKTFSVAKNLSFHSALDIFASDLNKTVFKAQ